MTEAQAASARPTAALGLFTLTALVIGNMIGAGVFTTSGFALADLAAGLAERRR